MAPLCRKRRTKHLPWPSLEARVTTNTHSRAGGNRPAPRLAGPASPQHPYATASRSTCHLPSEERGPEAVAGVGLPGRPRPLSPRPEAAGLVSAPAPPRPSPSQSDAGSLLSTSFNLPTRSSQSREQDRQVNRQRQRGVGTREAKASCRDGRMSKQSAEGSSTVISGGGAGD